MRNFAICLLLLNLVYLAWDQGWIPGSATETQMIVRNPMQQAPQSLVLLDELESLPPAVEQSMPEPVPAQPEADNDVVAAYPDQGAVCLAFGVLENLNDANAMLARVEQQGLQARIELQEQTDTEYRVYMPPFNSDAAARQTLVNLLENGIDSFIITDGDLAQGISLGVFSQQESAYRLQEQLAAQGYATSILQLVRSNTLFWLVVEPVSAAQSEQLWTEILSERSDLQLAENLCEIVAPEG